MEIDPELLHTPANPTGAGLVLTHGAGSNCRTPLLLAVAGMLTERGVTVLRYDLPFRQRGGTPHPSRAGEDRAALRSAAEALRAIAPGPIYLGGHSYGGRQSSMLAAEEPGLVAGLLLLSYPLHPPGKPESARTAHLPDLQTRTAFVHGTKDDFGTMDEMRAALTLIPAETLLHEVTGAGHDLKKGRIDISAALDFLL